MIAAGCLFLIVFPLIGFVLGMVVSGMKLAIGLAIGGFALAIAICAIGGYALVQAKDDR